MSKQEKLIEKLKNETIGADELRNLLKRLGFGYRQPGSSHQTWFHADGRRLTISPHGKDLKRYQIKEAQKVLLGE